MSPLPGWKPIHDGWAEHHRPVAASTMTSQCLIKRATGGLPPYPIPADLDGTEIIWTGRCRVQELKQETTALPGLQTTELRRYLIALPFRNDAGEPLPELRTGETGDTIHAVGRVFKLKQSMAGSELFQNDFIATENQTQQNP